MALSIKTEEADRLARQLAAATRESLTQAVTTALRERLDRVRRETAIARSDYLGDIRTLQEYAGRHAVDLAEDPISYDEHGLPR